VHRPTKQSTIVALCIHRAGCWLTEHSADRVCAPAQYRWHVYKSIREAIDKNEGGLEKFSQGYKYYGLNRGEHEGKKGTWYREWAPGARVRDPRPC